MCHCIDHLVIGIVSRERANKVVRDEVEAHFSNGIGEDDLEHFVVVVAVVVFVVEIPLVVLVASFCFRLLKNFISRPFVLFLSIFLFCMNESVSSTRLFPFSFLTIVSCCSCPAESRI